jgi:hypothetical protein
MDIGQIVANDVIVNDVVAGIIAIVHNNDFKWVIDLFQSCLQDINDIVDLSVD